MRRLVAILVIATLMLTVLSTPATANTHDEVASLLAGRVRAVNSGDKEAFMRTVDPVAPIEFRDKQSRQFDGLRSVPLAGYNLSVRTDDSGNLAPGLGLDASYGASTYLPETRQTYRLAGYDDRDAVDSLWITYVRRDGRWYVASDADTRIIGLDTAVNLWDSGALAVQRTPHLLVLTKPDQAARGAALAEIAERGMESFRSRWTRPWSERIPLLVPASPEEAAALLRTSADVARFSAFVSYTPIRDNGWDITPPRMYVQDANLAGETPESQSETIVHELTHAATAPLAGPFTPAWMHEGLATWIRQGRPSSFVRPAASERLPPSSEFSSASTGDLQQAYAAATSATAYLASIRDEDAPIRLFEAVGKRRLAPGSPSFNVDASLLEVAGISVAEFENAWLSFAPSG